jgi:hypothetical protein
MATILEFRPRAAIATAKPEAPPRADPALPYSFEIYQALPNGNVAVDACVPATVAAAMLDMLRAIA